MAFGFGVGAILAISKIIITSIKNICDAPEALQGLADRVEIVQANLESINRLPPDTAAGSAQNITRLVNRISEILEKLQNIVINFGETQGWKMPLSELDTPFWRKAKLKIWSRSWSNEPAI